MNSKNIISALETNYTTVSVAFDATDSDLSDLFLAHPRQYTYKIKASSDIKAGDYVVVPAARGGMTEFKTVRVMRRHSKPAIDYTVDFEYKWVIAKVDFTEYDIITVTESEMKSILEESALEKSKEEAFKVLSEKFGTATLERLSEVVKRIG